MRSSTAPFIEEFNEVLHMVSRGTDDLVFNVRAVLGRGVLQTLKISIGRPDCALSSVLEFVQKTYFDHLCQTICHNRSPAA